MERFLSRVCRRGVCLHRGYTEQVRAHDTQKSEARQNQRTEMPSTSHKKQALLDRLMHLANEDEM